MIPFYKYEYSQSRDLGILGAGRRRRAGMGHANIATTRIYDRCKMKPEDSPTFNVDY
jgi:hypothetical protein